MNIVILYYRYDDYDYTNYFSLIIDNELVVNDLPAEKLNEIYDKIKENCGQFVCTLVHDYNAEESEFDFKSDMNNNGITVHSECTADKEEICSVLSNCLNADFCEYRSDNAADKMHVKIVESLKCTIESSSDSINIPLPKDIPVEVKDEITELAKIIIEKYERKKAHE